MLSACSITNVKSYSEGSEVSTIVVVKMMVGRQVTFAMLEGGSIGPMCFCACVDLCDACVFS